MANNFGLFFTRDSTVIRLPVNPETLPVEKGNDNGEENVLGIGPIMIPRIPKLRIVTISQFFPGKPFPGVLTSGGFEPPEFYIDFFESAMNDKAPILYTPVRYYEDGTPYMTGDTGFMVLVTSFTYEERGGETGDFYYDLELTEYRDYSPLTIQIQGASQAGNAGTGQPITATTEPSREVPKGQLVVGSVCVANGQYYFSSIGGDSAGICNGQTVVVSRIVNGAEPFPVHVNNESGTALGWMEKAALQVVSDK